MVLSSWLDDDDDDEQRGVDEAKEEKANEAQQNRFYSASLEGMPLDCLAHIASFLPVAELAAFFRVSKAMRDARQSPRMWQEAYRQIARAYFPPNHPLLQTVGACSWDSLIQVVCLILQK